MSAMSGAMESPIKATSRDVNLGDLQAQESYAITEVDELVSRLVERLGPIRRQSSDAPSLAQVGSSMPLSSLVALEIVGQTERLQAIAQRLSRLLGELEV